MRELPSLKVPNSGAFTEYGEAMVNFSEDGKRIATGGFDTDTFIWETETGKRLSNLNGRTNMAYNVAFSADGTQLFPAAARVGISVLVAACASRQTRPERLSES